MLKLVIFKKKSDKRLLLMEKYQLWTIHWNTIASKSDAD